MSDLAKFTRTILGMDGEHCWHPTAIVDGVRCCQCGVEGRQPTHYERDPMHGSHVEVKIRVLDPVIVYSENPDAPCIPSAPPPEQTTP